MREMIGSVSSRWASSDPQAALEWASELDGVRRVAASDYLIRNLAYSGKDEMARAALVDLITDQPQEAAKGGRLERAIYSVMEKAGSNDPQAGIAIINQLGTEQAQAHAIEALIGSWAISEPAEAHAWVGQLPAGRVRDTAAQRMVQQTANRDGAASFEMALSIENEQMRTGALGLAVETWLKQDSATARAAIESADLSDQERAGLLDRAD